MGWRLTCLVGVIVVAVAGISLAAGKGSSNVVLCVAKKSGDVQLASKGKCGKGEKKLAIAKRGPRGPAGTPGTAGADGADGTPADVAPEPLHLVSPTGAGDDGTDCAGSPGKFCGYDPSSGCTPSYANFANSDDSLAPVGYRKDAGGFVHLQGSASNGSGGIDCPNPPPGVFYLPPNYRPTTGSLRFPASRNCAEPPDTGKPLGTVVVGTDGLIRVDATGCFSLDGVIFHP